VLLRDLADDIDSALAEAVRSCHDHDVHPWSWTEIADRLGMTRQAARQRWAEPLDGNATAYGPAHWRLEPAAQHARHRASARRP